jgi:hypothetical protein
MKFASTHLAETPPGEVDDKGHAWRLEGADVGRVTHACARCLIRRDSARDDTGAPAVTYRRPRMQGGEQLGDVDPGCLPLEVP